jgi:MFS family permease
MMAITRTFYGKKADKLPLAKTLVICSVISVIGYLTVSLSPYPYLALFGCGLVGIGVAMFWPGVLSIASKALPTGGAPMFAILAMFGDIGCSVGPQASAFVSEIFGGKLKAGLLFSTVFSVIVGVSLTVYLLRAKAKKNAEAKIDE